MPIFKKKERSKTYNLRLQGIRKRMKESKVSRRKEITKIRAEINEIQTTKIIEKINETKQYVLK